MVPFDKNKIIVNGIGSIKKTMVKSGINDVEDVSQDSLKYHSISEGPKQKISRQIAVMHQKNSQSFMNN